MKESESESEGGDEGEVVFLQPFGGGGVVFVFQGDGEDQVGGDLGFQGDAGF